MDARYPLAGVDVIGTWDRARQMVRQKVIKGVRSCLIFDAHLLCDLGKVSFSLWASVLHLEDQSI